MGDSDSSYVHLVRHAMKRIGEENVEKDQERFERRCGKVQKLKQDWREFAEMFVDQKVSLLKEAMRKRGWMEADQIRLPCKHLTAGGFKNYMAKPLRENVDVRLADDSEIE